MSVSTFFDFSSLTFAMAVGVQRSLKVRKSQMQFKLPSILPKAKKKSARASEMGKIELK
jgi:hypothetical protein